MNKILSVLVIYALFLNELVPFTQAMVTNEDFVVGINSSSSFEEQPVNSVQPELQKSSEVAEVVEGRMAPPTVKVTTNNGPSQSETSGFSINSTDGMVDKFTGDFSYSIPLMDVEGYPVVLSYNSNVNMLTDASWVGLGWDLNVGSISREMRGIPDEFNGNDIVERTFNQKDNTSDGDKKGTYFGISTVAGIGVQVTALFGNYTNSFLGLGKTVDLGLQGQFSISNAGSEGLFLGASFNLGFNYDSKSGIGRSQSIGLSGGYTDGSERTSSGNISYGTSFNSRMGLTHKTISLGTSTGYQNGPTTSMGASSTMTYGTSTSVPRIRQSTSGVSHNNQFDTYFRVKLSDALTLKMGMLAQNYTSSSEVITGPDKTNSHPAYGYLHSGKRRLDNHILAYPIMDFNRGNDAEFSEEMHDLPFSVQTHDVFYVNASGLGASFRPQRKDYGTYYDPNTQATFNSDAQIGNNDTQTNFGTGLVYDVSLPTSIGFGMTSSSGVMKGDIASGNWNETSVLEFNSQPQANSFDEAVYFKSIGEHTPVDMNAFDDLSNTTPARMIIGTTGSDIALTVTTSTGQTVNGATLNDMTVPTYSATTFGPKTAEQVASSGTTNLSFYIDEDDIRSSNIDNTFPVNAGIRGANHISSIDVVSPDGTRYKYGTPVYNVFSTEVSFATGASATAFALIPVNNMVTYEAGVDNHHDFNQHGMSNYYEKTEVPSYAHSFLLNQMISSDYIDVGNDGLSIDDVGSFYKFNHTCLYSADQANAFKWRMPVSGGVDAKAFYHQGTLGSTMDDLGNYSYGEKEIWYTHSIESKNMVACFLLEDREDAYSVASEDGGLIDTPGSERRLKCLKQIVLYNKSEKLLNPNDAIPLQTIEFYYDYTLCENAPANANTYTGGGPDSGKLTLKEIRVFSGTSDEAALATYTFDYGTENPNSITLMLIPGGLTMKIIIH